MPLVRSATSPGSRVNEKGLLCELSARHIASCCTPLAPRDERVVLLPWIDANLYESACDDLLVRSCHHDRLLLPQGESRVGPSHESAFGPGVLGVVSMVHGGHG